MSTSNLHLVLGAGPVGLAVAKALKAADIPYRQVEADDDVGGNWYHGTYRSAHILSSRTAMEYPDFRMPVEYPDFPSSQQMYEYYCSYAEHFGLREHIDFRTKVTHVRSVENNLWEVTFSDGSRSVYKGVIVCNGHHWKRRFPEFQGSFSGTMLHSKDYKSYDQIIDKKVLVVGAGNSAFDIAAAAGRLSTSCRMSVRRGIWIFPKTFMGRPISDFRGPRLPLWLQKSLVKVVIRLTLGPYTRYGLQTPKIGVFDRHPTVNTETLIYIKNGSIAVRGDVKKLDGRFVEFEDGMREEFDTIICATGFHVSFPFLDEKLDRVEGSVVKTYGLSMYDDFKGLYLVGWMQPRGGVGSLIAPYSDMLANLIQVQEEEISCPVGMVLREMGEPLPTSHLMGSQDLTRRIARMNKNLGKIKRKGQILDKTNGQFQNAVLPEVSAKPAEMPVY